MFPLDQQQSPPPRPPPIFVFHLQHPFPIVFPLNPPTTCSSFLAPPPPIQYITASLWSSAAPQQRCHGNSGTTAGWPLLRSEGVASEPPFAPQPPPLPDGPLLLNPWIRTELWSVMHCLQLNNNRPEMRELLLRPAAARCTTATRAFFRAWWCSHTTSFHFFETLRWSSVNFDRSPWHNFPVANWCSACWFQKKQKH